jgi:hypothetical protein
MYGLAPVGNYLPIDQVRPEIAEAYVQEVWVKAQKMLAGCKETCDENKVRAWFIRVAFFYIDPSKCSSVSCSRLIESVPLSVG